MTDKLSKSAVDIINAGLSAARRSETAASVDRAVEDAVAQISLDSSLRSEGEGQLVTALLEIAKEYVREKAQIESN